MVRSYGETSNFTASPISTLILYILILPFICAITSCLDSLISTISKQIRDGERRELMRKIENKEVSADEEADLLQQLIDQEREDQGLT